MLERGRAGGRRKRILGGGFGRGQTQTFSSRQSWLLEGNSEQQPDDLEEHVLGEGVGAGKAVHEDGNGIGPFLPFITFSNSLKSNFAPASDNLSLSNANSVAFILPLVPSGIVYNTLLLVVAKVSSKSHTLIPLIGCSGKWVTSKAVSGAKLLISSSDVIFSGVAKSATTCLAKGASISLNNSL